MFDFHTTILQQEDYWHEVKPKIGSRSCTKPEFRLNIERYRTHNCQFSRFRRNLIEEKYAINTDIILNQELTTFALDDKNHSTALFFATGIGSTFNWSTNRECLAGFHAVK